MDWSLACHHLCDNNNYFYLVEELETKHVRNDFSNKPFEGPGPFVGKQGSIDISPSVWYISCGALACHHINISQQTHWEKKDIHN